MNKVPQVFRNPGGSPALQDSVWDRPLLRSFTPYSNSFVAFIEGHPGETHDALFVDIPLLIMQ
jgi:hypothetical protein